MIILTRNLRPEIFLFLVVTFFTSSPFPDWRLNFSVIPLLDRQSKIYHKRERLLGSEKLYDIIR
jgi:hypothetical protein